ncbi:hypothetical protein TanjilG_07474 [Lupinus angustifolius]|uniref:PROP1-like PPR domain-containing protein n=1 Tax=Lupinus angustifolius TaxID=3871 RepID=A0A4P1QUT4_LUPAN|nr:PREDICTED: pentatricopeptide repeat-containing protein At1g63330-like [Lupinus angustifolius]OIV95318.1 hypothetical protein TanjilG_07474 [Lupinus angustifolius]
MALKFQSLAYSTQIRKWVFQTYFISSCATHVEDISEIIGNPNDSSEFNQNLNFLKNNLAPQNLIRVLDNTSDLNSAVKIFKWASMQKSFHHSSNTYFQIILKLGMSGNDVEMSAFCKKLLKEKCHGAEEALVELVHTFVKNCRINEAMMVFMNINLSTYKPPVEVFNVLLGALVEESRRDFHKALFVYKEMVKAGILPNVNTLNYLLEALFMRNQVDLALNQFRRMNNKGCSPNSKTFEIVVKGLMANGRVDEAVSVTGEMVELKYQPDLSFYTCCIPLFCRENKVEEGVRLFEMMKASDILPDSLIYSVLVECLCKNLRLDSAISLVNEMIESGIQPTDNVFVDLVDCYCELGKVNEAIMFLEDNQVSDTASYNVLLEGCCNAGKIPEAYILLEKMSERNIADRYSWNILIRWLCENEETGKAYELLGKMIKFSFNVDHVTFSALVVGKCRMRKYEDAMVLFRQNCSRCWVLDFTSYSELVGGLCDVQNCQNAIEVFSYMSSKRLPLHSLSFFKLIKCVCGVGQINKAIKLWQLAYHCGTSCCIATHTTIMCELSKSGKANDLLVVLSRILVDGCNFGVETYSILIDSMSKENRVNECVLFFNVMVNESLIPDPDTLFDQLSFIAKHSQLCMISSAIDKLVSESENLNPAIYGLLIAGLWKEGKKHEARRLLDLMLEKGWLPDATTHKLLIGSDVEEGRSQEMLLFDHSSVQDAVSDILAEGLGET